MILFQMKQMHKITPCFVKIHYLLASDMSQKAFSLEVYL
jgi:hypothetical protein